MTIHTPKATPIIVHTPKPRPSLPTPYIQTPKAMPITAHTPKATPTPFPRMSLKGNPMLRQAGPDGKQRPGKSQSWALRSADSDVFHAPAGGPSSAKNDAPLMIRD
ncbi:hypothetical protein AAFF_G00282650 [Aldrovandia affinis]|uniref:Uncharacterized protein n=1 Tax=Aldrovandia affinis TaxID=143900 RepID=A0AAD7TA86_9TELE|nr:hypothetical protein AAFF_G00282650 [Aldrovandia affinis]